MKLTKYEHACIVLEEQGKRLIVDPGIYSENFGGTGNVVAVVITHVHDDHFGAENVRKIIAANPDATVYTTQEAANELQGGKVVVPELGKDYAAGEFTLRFYGELHAELHPILPRAQNIGLSVNGTFYYPGDSFTLPGHDVATVAVPSGGGWMKVGEAINFMQAIKARQFIPTHDIALSQLGRTWVQGNLSKAAQQLGAKFTPLRPGDPIDI